jgi:hypothetical protein
MDGDACTAACGHCGRCSPWYDRPNDDDPIVHCAVCGTVIERVSIAVPITKAFVVTCCSELCAGDVLASRGDE